MKSISIDYKFPMTFPDNMIIATSFGNLSKDRFTQFSLLLSEKEEKVVAQCLGTVVMYDHSTLKKAPLLPGYNKCFEAITKEFGPQIPFNVPRY